MRSPTLGHMTAPRRIAVLGLGRMGTAIATRLNDHGWDVVGWTRSGRPAGAVATADDPNDALAKADIVVLALFDGRACQQVVDQVRDSLRADTVVVNISTIAPAEAAKLTGQLGRSYVHAPVLGSVPAVAAGALRILAAIDPGTLGRVLPVLNTLGTVRHMDDASTAAALKLIANNSLAGAVLALRDTLRQADALGLPRTHVLDVLELGQLGGLVARNRTFLADQPSVATTERPGRRRPLSVSAATMVGMADARLRSRRAMPGGGPAVVPGRGVRRRTRAWQGTLVGRSCVATRPRFRPGVLAVR
jgi:3-hydroxyisobutyrate dehydrogenase-like beta-hydroxyacid dehydrogenase